ncbi:MAG: hypothetical protein Unbinned400contig1002_18 [Prokaryotic dsDNA virus sp.]|nr:MAG: hypothetical protein Unbinned400contig1002_18 [Prokaryotic dsDNA virus sp.]|tara:strand:+ start:16436 stop:17155 length:720 start_codon:yes stop_codon:yes gene_type:complete
MLGEIKVDPDYHKAKSGIAAKKKSAASKRKSLRDEAAAALRGKVGATTSLMDRLRSDQVGFRKAHGEATSAGVRDIGSAAAENLAAALGQVDTGAGAKYSAGRQAAMDAGLKSSSFRADQAKELAGAETAFTERLGDLEQKRFDQIREATDFEAQSLDDVSARKYKLQSEIQAIMSKHSGYFNDDERAAAAEIFALADAEEDPDVEAWLRKVANAILTDEIDMGDKWAFTGHRDPKSIL